MKPIIEAIGISKRFGDTLALDGVDFDLYPGEIHGLCGANGSGKSTFLNIINGHGVIAGTGGYSGELRVHGEPVRFRSPRDSSGCGIGMVHQELSLVGDLNVAANIRFGREAGYPITERLLGPQLALVDEGRTRQAASRILERMGVAVEPHRRVAELPVNLKQLVEIGREIGRELKVLILDEPTACLGEADSLSLFSLLKGLKQKGLAIILVTHRLEELKALCDRVTVFRDGKRVAVYARQAIEPETLAWDMLGKSVAMDRPRREEAPGGLPPLLQLRGFKCWEQGRLGAAMDLEVAAGEILGFTGLAGHGYNLLPYGLMGLMPWSGEAFFKGESLTGCPPESIIRRGVFFLPDERKELGLMLNCTVQENMVLAAQNSLGSCLHPSPLRELALIDGRAARKLAEQLINDLEIRCSGPDQPVWQLSGGNQQKVCIARALLLKPELLFVGEPTRGMDIHAKELILDQLTALHRTHGTTLVIASGELDELCRVCDRIAVFHEGKMNGLFAPDVPRQQLVRALAGERGAWNG